MIAAAGQLIPRKGHQYLLQAVAVLKDRYKQLRLIVFGDGYLSNQLRAQAASLRLGDVVQFVGFREDLNGDRITDFTVFDEIGVVGYRFTSDRISSILQSGETLLRFDTDSDGFFETAMRLDGLYTGSFTATPGFIDSDIATLVRYGPVICIPENWTGTPGHRPY